MMQLSDRGIVALVAHEGIVPGPYLDSVGVWTYGIGHTASAGLPDPTGLRMGFPDDLDAALVDVFKVFIRDIKTFETRVNNAITVPLEQSQFDALVSFDFNTGGITKANATALINRRAYVDGGKALMGWSKPASIIPRREAERDLFLTGKYPVSPANVWGVNAGGKVIWKVQRAISPAHLLDFVAQARGSLATTSATVSASLSERLAALERRLAALEAKS